MRTKLNARQQHALKAKTAYRLKELQYTFEEIALAMALKSKERARMLVAKGDRLINVVERGFGIGVQAVGPLQQRRD